MPLPHDECSKIRTSDFRGNYISLGVAQGFARMVFTSLSMLTGDENMGPAEQRGSSSPQGIVGCPPTNPTGKGVVAAARFGGQCPAC